MKKIILLIVATLLAVTCSAQSQGAKTVVLEKNEGEARVRRPFGVLPIPTAEFILKVTPENSGSKHLVLGTEDIPPGGVIPRHKHLEQDEILLVQTGTAHVTLDDKEYDVHAGGTVFFPAQTWVSLKNIGKDSISLVFIFSAPGFEKNMRCGSVPAGQSAPPINTDELKACAHEGHVEYEALRPSALVDESISQEAIWGSNCMDRFSSTNPVHRLTETVQERIKTKGFQTKPSPTQLEDAVAVPALRAETQLSKFALCNAGRAVQSIALRVVCDPRHVG